MLLARAEVLEERGLVRQPRQGEYEAASPVEVDLGARPPAPG